MTNEEASKLHSGDLIKVGIVSGTTIPELLALQGQICVVDQVEITDTCMVVTVKECEFILYPAEIELVLFTS